MAAKKEEFSTNFQKVPSFEKFTIVVGDLPPLDSKLKDEKIKYYKLCCSQGMLLHEHLHCGNFNFAVSVISQTTKIAEEIGASKITTSQDTLLKWQRSLEGYEYFGMNVRFLLDKLEELKASSAKYMLTSKRYTETRIKRDQAEETMKNLQLKLEEVNKNISRIGAETDSSIMSLKRVEAEFQHLANAPW